MAIYVNKDGTESDARVEAAFLEELKWIEDERQRDLWLKEWLRVYEIGRKAATGEE